MFCLFCLLVYLILSEDIESMQHSFHNHRYQSFQPRRHHVIRKGSSKAAGVIAIQKLLAEAG